MTATIIPFPDVEETEQTRNGTNEKRNKRARIPFIALPTRSNYRPDQIPNCHGKPMDAESAWHPPSLSSKSRQRLGIRQGSRIEFLLVGDHVEMRVRSSPSGVPGNGFGMLAQVCQL